MGAGPKRNGVARELVNDKAAGEVEGEKQEEDLPRL